MRSWWQSLRTLSSADGVINGANMLMLTGTIGDAAIRKSFINKMGATDDVADLKIIRGEKVRKLTGAPARATGHGSSPRAT